MASAGRAGGRQPRLLMCKPDYYGIEYEINTWMDRHRAVDHGQAVRQWTDLVSILNRIGACIEFVPPVDGLPDMVFTANAGLIHLQTFVGSSFRHAERQGESPHFEQWFADRGFKTVAIPEGLVFEGAGDALFCGDVLIAGYMHRSEFRAHQQLARLLGCQVLGLELVDPRFYHLDTCFCPLEPGVALLYPGAFDEYGRRVLTEHIPTLIEVDESDAARFACNAVVIGRQVVLNSGTARTCDELSRRGYEPHPTDLSEFLKAGGAAKCLTLRLDGEEAATWAAQARSGS